MRLSAGIPATRWLSLALLPGIALLGGCQRAGDDVVDVAVIGPAAAPLVRGARLGPAGQLVQAATAQGLVTLDAQGQVVPGLADRWTVTDDGASYIFRLRDGTWPDGAPIAAEGIARALRRALDNLRGTPLGLDLADIGEVRVMTDRVMELRLTRPVPELLQLLAQPELGLWNRDQGGGPMRLRREAGGDGQQGVVRLTVIPPASLGLPPPDEASAAPRAVRLHALAAAAATAAFARGEVAAVLGGTFATLPLARDAAGLSRQSLQFDPVQGLFGLAVVSAAGPLGAVDFREALALALDRDALGNAIGLTGQTASVRTVPANAAANGPALAASWAALPLTVRRTQAAARVARWRARYHGALPPLRLSLPDGPGADALFAQLSADLAAIGITVRRVGETAPADLRLLDIVARYPGAMWYVNQLSCPARTICSAAADVALAAARAERDPVRRAALLAEAEAAISAASLFLPLGPPVRWALVRDDLPGFVPNSTAFHPLPALSSPAG